MLLTADKLPWRLQWGRGLKTPEMAPTPRAVADLFELQWGRGLKTPEILNRGSHQGTTTELQWGRGLKTPEIRRRQAVTRAEAVASMGPGS